MVFSRVYRAPIAGVVAESTEIVLQDTTKNLWRTAMTGDGLTAFERALLVELVGAASRPPADLAVALDSDLATVLDAAGELHERGLLARQGFNSCRLTDRGRAAVADDVESAGSEPVDDGD